jgi:hypothetical protein
MGTEGEEGEVLNLEIGGGRAILRLRILRLGNMGWTGAVMLCILVASMIATWCCLSFKQVAFSLFKFCVNRLHIDQIGENALLKKHPSTALRIRIRISRLALKSISFHMTSIICASRFVQNRCRQKLKRPIWKLRPRSLASTIVGHYTTRRLESSLHSNAQAIELRVWAVT